MLFQNFAISLEIWISVLWFALPPPSANVCAEVLGSAGVCTHPTVTAPAAPAGFDVAAASGLRVSNHPSCCSDCPGSAKGNVFNNYRISPECCIQWVFAITVSGYNYPWFESCRSCSWTISGRPWQDTVGAGSWLKVLLLLVLNCAKHLPTSTGKIILSFSC